MLKTPVLLNIVVETLIIFVQDSLIDSMFKKNRSILYWPLLNSSVCMLALYMYEKYCSKFYHSELYLLLAN